MFGRLYALTRSQKPKKCLLVRRLRVMMTVTIPIRSKDTGGKWKRVLQATEERRLTMGAILRSLFGVTLTETEIYFGFFLRTWKMIFALYRQAKQLCSSVNSTLTELYYKMAIILEVITICLHFILLYSFLYHKTVILKCPRMLFSNSLVNK